MSAGYVAVGWSGRKKAYDAVVAAGVGLYLLAFVGLGAYLFPQATAETLAIRGLGSAAFLLLHVILAIGPLCRLDPRFLPLLYNRRHLGVVTFLLGAAHGTFALIQFHAGGDANPFASLLAANTRWNSLADFPFQQLGAGALVILFLMAATSHDFWLANLSPKVWKALHMGVYFAYALLVMHVALGVLQDERSPWLAGLLGAGIVTILSLHLAAAMRERRRDRPRSDAGAPDGWIDVGAAAEIPEKRAKVVVLGAERVAVFRYDGKISALSNVCRHQNGPLGEGKIVDGCITCPWHGYQYLPDSGSSPPPFQEKVETYRVAVRAGRVFVHRQALPPGTRVEPARIEGGEAPAASGAPEFFIGWQEPLPPRLARRMRAVVAAGLVLAVLAGLLVAAAQKPFAPAIFEYGRPRTFSGRLQAGPIPMLWVLPSDRHPEVTSAGYALVAPGKHGASALAASWAGRAVRLRGTLIRRGGRGMIEVQPGTIESGPESAPALPAEERLGPATVDGVIADAKCWLGVMNPGEGKVHRDCAVRCLAGGVPPLVLGAAPESKNYWLAGRGGRPIEAKVLDRVAEPVRLRGEVVRFDDQLVLEIESGDDVVRREPDP